MKVCNSLWTNKTKRKGHSKINEQIKRNLYTWITRHPQVVQSLFSNDCLKVVLYDQTEPLCLFTNILDVKPTTAKHRFVDENTDANP